MSVVPLIRQLVEIADLHKELNSLAERLTRIPYKREMAEKRPAELEVRRDTARRLIDETLARRRRLDGQLKDLDARRRRYREQRESVASEREFESLTHQIERVEAEITAAEDAGLECLETEEAAQRDLETADRELEQARADRDRQLKKFDEEEAELKRAIELAEAEHRNRLASLPEDALPVWQRLESKFGAEAVVPVAESGACDGCDMRLQPSVRDAALMMRELTTCHNCGRILYDAERLQAEG